MGGARKKMYEAGPLLCAKCHIRMKIIAVIDKPSVIDKILKHLQYRFEVTPLTPLPTQPPRPLSPFLWSAEDFSQFCFPFSSPHSRRELSVLHTTCPPF